MTTNIETRWPCPHGIEHEAALTVIELEYEREQATGAQRSKWLCGCCMSPSGDERRCPSCLVEGE